ncbi:MAG: tRNA (guanosine(37)-N1)-methyltransferase TrmD [Nitrospirae bacterium]|nr:tRNA (guanosine(37)-N1)-methyltransferase TrmD [Nitrospirota bacterium]
MKFSVVTIFPEIITTYLGTSILKRAISRDLINVDVYNLRDYASDKHNTVDDYPYGGGAGMVLKPEPFFALVDRIWPDATKRRIVLLSPQGRVFNQETALELAKEQRETVLFCGRYEAIDERVKEYLADDEFSVGNYVLTGGELPALVIIDAVARLVPGVLGDSRSPEADSFSCGLLDYPHYTRPENFRGMSVPPVLLCGNHSKILRWRKMESLRRTLEKRPELLENYSLSSEEKKLLDEIKEELP